jgi:vancomycin resistance protein YoaR
MEAIRYRQTSPLGQALIALLGGLFLFTLMLGIVPFGYSTAYSGQIYPGVSVAGIDLSGLNAKQAAELLAQRLDYTERGQLVFQEGTNLWAVKPRQVGLFLDSHTSAAAAYNVGRNGGFLSRLSGQFRAWYQGTDIAPLFLLDERVALEYLETIAAQVDKPVIEASLSVNGVEVIVQPGQVGRSLDIPAALASLRAQVQTMTDGLIPLVVKETSPVILDVTEQAEIARRILSAPLVINVPDAEEDDPGPWTYEPMALAQMLSIERIDSPEGSRYQVGLSSHILRNFLGEIATQFVRYPENARFIFNDETRELEIIRPGVIGRELDIETSFEQINEKVMAGEHSATLSMVYTDPAVTDDTTAADLGISEQVSVHTSYFYGSSSDRIQNIQIASAQFHGILVPPGATFSMADVLGDVSLDNGYAEALIIFGNRTIKGVGGGVCQVSTTLFRTAFFGGFPIVERYPHAYRVGYYEQTASGGINPSLCWSGCYGVRPRGGFKIYQRYP